MKTLLTITRFIVGILFIFSGLVKANDPLGLSYKMQEFFEVWGLVSLNAFSLAMSILMIGFEIIAGVAVILGWRFRLFSWLLLILIIFFTFLTGYALFSGKIRECGCFGNCFRLTASDSFIKDIILTGMIIYLFLNRNMISNTHGGMALITLTVTTLFSFGIQWYVLNNLPLVDCLPYKIGKNINEEIKIPAGAIPDSTVISFVYKKEGKDIEFDADHFPADFSDSLYTFVKRYDKVVRQGNAEPPIKDFVLITPANNDTTTAILQQPGKMLILFSQNWQPEWNASVEKLNAVAAENKIPLIISTASADKARESLDLPIMKSDLVAIRTAARVDPTLYLLEQGKIIQKWPFRFPGKAISDIQNNRY